MPHIFRVGEITRALKDVIEGQFPFVWVRGQVSNLARPASGHVYFSLKDEEAVLGVAWFRGSQSGQALGGGEERFDPLTGEVLEPGGGSAWLGDGAEVLCAGRLTVYGPRGAYQLVAEYVQDMGLGRLYREFEELKRKLAARGLFDQSRKRALPVLPERVAVITSPTGAAIRDFLRVAGARGCGCEIRVYPCLVQGESAPVQIARALDAAGADGWAQVVAAIRGGGSIEDLWAFNTEEVALAMAHCPIPVVCGVGHEVDVTIADMAADVRAATPSHAAQILWPEREVLAQRADEARLALDRAFSRFMRGSEERLAVLGKALAWLSPGERLERLSERLAGLSGRLGRAAGSPIERAGAGLEQAENRLMRAGRELPDEASRRLEGLAGRLGASGRALPSRGEATLSSLSARLLRAGRALPEAREQGLAGLSRRLYPAVSLTAERAESALAVLSARLEGANPSAPLERGYALARLADGTYLRSVGDVSPHDALDVIVRDGAVSTRVTGVKKAES
jgi:exodeoxyribonuclease VII large subunit